MRKYTSVWPTAPDVDSVSASAPRLPRHRVQYASSPTVVFVACHGRISASRGDTCPTFHGSPFLGLWPLHTYPSRAYGSFAYALSTWIYTSLSTSTTPFVAVAPRHKFLRYTYGTAPLFLSVVLIHDTDVRTATVMRARVLSPALVRHLRSCYIRLGS